MSGLADTDRRDLAAVRKRIATAERQLERLRAAEAALTRSLANG